MTRPYPPTQENLGEEPTLSGQAEKPDGDPSLDRAIAWAKDKDRQLREGYGEVYILRTDGDIFRRLVSAAEFEQRNASKAFDCYSARWQQKEVDCPIRAEKDRRIEELEAQLKREDAWRRHADETADKLTSQLKTQKEMRREAYQAAIDESEDAEKLRSRLAEKERGVEHFKDLEKRGNETIRHLTDIIEDLGHQLKDFRLATNPDFIEAMSKIAQGFRETNIDWSKVKERTVLVDPEPTPPEKSRRASEAAVEKVAEELFVEGKACENLAWANAMEHVKEIYRREARLAIERGYRAEE